MNKINWKEINWKKIPGKKLALSIGAGAAAAAIVGGIVFGVRGKQEPVNVYPFDMVGMTEYWGDNQESYGPVTTDNIQTVFLSDTQIITGVPVEVGAHVKKGDVLMSYDTTLSELELERKRLDVEKAKLKVQEAEEELRRINQMQPSGGSVSITEPDYGATLGKDKYKVCTDETFDGSSPDKALVCWLQSDIPINDSILQALYQQVLHNQELNTAGLSRSSASAVPDVSVPPTTEDPVVPPTSEDNTVPTDTQEHPATEDSSVPPVTEKPAEPVVKPPANTALMDITPEQPRIWSAGSWKYDASGKRYLEVEKGKAVNLTFLNQRKGNTDWIITPAQGELKAYIGERSCFLSGWVSQDVEYTVTACVGSQDNRDSLSFKLIVKEPEPSSKKPINNFYVILKKTAGDQQKAFTTLWQGIQVYVYNSNDYGFSFFDAPPETDFFPDSDSGVDFDFDFGSGMTSAEIAQMRREQTKLVQELTEAAQMLDAEYRLMEREFNDGNVRAEMDGEVVSLLTEDEARGNKQPFIKVSGGGGFYVEGSVSELEKDNLQIGQSVTVNDWNTGNTYEGQVESIGDFPASSYSWNGAGNPTASYYPFRVFIDGSADLQAGGYVSISYSSAQAQDGVFLENPFLRTDEAEPYVYVRGKHGKLEKRTVTTGRSLWGSYTEIRSGLSAEDFVAFPYGKTVKPGAATREGDISALYGY